MLWFLLIGLIAGWLAGKIVRGGGYGLIGDLIVGVAGSYIGGYMYKILGLSTYGIIGEIFMATIGAIALLWVIRLIK